MKKVVKLIGGVLFGRLVSTQISSVLMSAVFAAASLLAVHAGAAEPVADGLSNNGAARWLQEQEVEFLKVDQAFALTTEQCSDG